MGGHAPSSHGLPVIPCGAAEASFCRRVTPTVLSESREATFTAYGTEEKCREMLLC